MTGRPTADPAELAALIARAFPGDGLSAQGLPEAAARRAIAAWLATNPFPGLAPHACKLNRLGNHLCDEHADLWCNPAYAWPKLKHFLLAPESRGVFVVADGAGPGHEWVRLDVIALRRAAAVEATLLRPANTDQPLAAGSVDRVAAAVKAAAAAASSLAGTAPVCASTSQGQRREVTPAPSVAAAARLPPPHEQLETLFLNRFPAFGLAAAERLANAAKRAAAKLLALALPSRTLSLGHLEKAVPVIMAGAQPPRKLRELCDEDPDVFHVWLQPPSTWMVGLFWGEVEALVGAPQEAVCASASASANAPRGNAGYYQDSRGFEAGLKTLWRALHARFPEPDKVPELEPERLCRAAKRYVARGLATAPGHVRKLDGFLRTMPPDLLGDGTGPPVERLRALCEEEPDVFRVWEQPPGVWMVRLACPQLAKLGEAAGGTAPHAQHGPATTATAGEGLSDTACWQAMSANGEEEKRICGSANAATSQYDPSAEPTPTPAPVAVAELPSELPPQPTEALAAAPIEAACSASMAACVLPPARVCEPELLAPARVRVVSDPFTPALAAMLQHCRACTHLGLAVHSYGGAPAVVCIYTPPVAWARVPGTAEGAACDHLEAGAASGGAVYVVDLAAAATSDAARMLLFSVRGLMEDPALGKMVHGREQVRVLEAAWGGAAIAPLLDSRLLVKGLTAMLDIRPPPPPPPPSTSAASTSPAGAASACLAQATAHVSTLRSGLAAAGLWADRPDLLSALSAVHFAALRDELEANEGGGIAWGCRPLSASQVGAAAASARHLPELWAALWEASYLASAGKVGTRRNG